MAHIQSFLCENYIPKISFSHLNCTIAVLQASTEWCIYTFYNCTRHGVSTAFSNYDIKKNGQNLTLLSSQIADGKTSRR